SFIPSIGRVRFNQLETHFGKMEHAWKASTGELKQARLDESVIKAINTWRPKIDLDAEMAKIEKYEVKVFTWHDEKYPARLKEIYDYPPLLYIKGEITPADEWCLAVVGTRRVTIYGRQVTEEIVTDLARNNITIVSGLARGVDSIAHQAALDAGGRTLAVLAGGLDTIYPTENTNMARRIEENGALISEYPPGTRPRPDHFPRRNRILSGMTLGTLVTEAGEGSGALITADMALEQNRDVLAVPGSILSPASYGTNKLIKQGAKLVQSCQDILEELNLRAVAQQMEFKEILPTTDTEKSLLGKLSTEPVHIDEICATSGLPVATVSSTLAMMELKGMVRSAGNMSYILARETRETYGVKVE
ncbi:MAG: DNA-processing protein DprA, partial [Dehalococcoidales bacterium]|nr:DNA-processing protein DprA [Dehalococcoidales bacterium]